jgi:hypothetical protein
MHGLRIEFELAGLDLGEVEHLVDEAEQVGTSAVHALQRLLRLFSAEARRGVRSSWLTLDTNCDLCSLACWSWRLLSSISRLTGVHPGSRAPTGLQTFAEAESFLWESCPAACAGSRAPRRRGLRQRVWTDADCVVGDPTGTPLNVRSRPNGPILGALHNDTPVLVLATNGRQKVGTQETKYIPTSPISAARFIPIR